MLTPVAAVALTSYGVNVVVEVPAEFAETLQRYTSCGLRVIAFAMKSLDRAVTWKHVQRMSR